MRAVPGPLVALAAVAALLSVAWSLATPLMQGPDESAHYAAVARLAEDGRVVPRDGDEGLPRDLLLLGDLARLSPLIGNLEARPAWSAAEEARWRAADARLGEAGRAFLDRPEAGPPTRGTARNPPLYAAYGSVAYAAASSGTVVGRMQAVRLLNVPLVVVTVVACWLLAAELLPRSPLAPVVAGALAALQPQLTFLSGVVNPDNLLVALSAVATLAAVRLVRRGLSARRVAVLLAVSVAATLTHARGAVLLPVAAAALLLALPWGRMAPGRRRLVVAGVLGAAVAATAGYVALASALGVSAAGSSQYSRGGLPLREFVSYVWQFYLPGLPWMAQPLGGDAYGLRQVGVETAWGTFGSLEVRFPGWVYDLLTAALAVAVAGIVAALVARRDAVRAQWRTAALLALLVGATLLSLHVVAFRLMRVDPSDPIIVGRHWLVLLAPFAAGVAFAVTSLPRRAAPYAAALLLGGLVLLQCGGLGLTLARFYA